MHHSSTDVDSIHLNQLVLNLLQTQADENLRMRKTPSYYCC